MANDRNDDQRTGANAGSGSDTDAAFQEELRREEGEGSDLPGDMKSDRNLAGSSTWETLPDDADPGNEGRSGSSNR
jgi:hypothetical protein